MSLSLPVYFRKTVILKAFVIANAVLPRVMFENSQYLSHP